MCHCYKMCISKPERAVYKNKEQTGIYQVTALANNKITWKP